MLLGSICLAVVLVVPFVVACAGPAPSPTPSPTPSPSPTLTPTPSPTEEVYKWRFQHTWGAAENHFFEQYADIVRGMSGGRIDMEVYSSCELVPDEEILDALAMGTLDMAQSHPDYHLGTVPVGAVEQMPYLYLTIDEKMAVMYQWGLDDVIREAFYDVYGVRILDFSMCDPGTIILTEDIETIADLKGRRLSVMDPLASILAEQAGTTATYLPPEEIYTALALGTIDGVEYGSAVAMSDMGFHEVAKYFVQPNYQISWFSLYAISDENYNTMPPDLIDILRQGVRAHAVHMRSLYNAREVEAIEKMRKAGVKVVQLSDEDIATLFRGTLKALDELKGESTQCEEAVNIIMEALKKFGRVE